MFRPRQPRRLVLLDSAGSITILAALSVPILLGICALAVDASHTYLVRRQLQTAADAGALAGAMALSLGQSSSVSKATQLANANAPAGFGVVAKSSDVTFGAYDPSGASLVASRTSPSAVQVVAHRDSAHSNSLPASFAQTFGIGTFDISAKAIATMAQKPCLIILSRSASPALSVTGSAGMNAETCIVAVNSSAANAAIATAQATAKKFCFVGGYSGSFFPTAQHCPAVSDPLLAIPEPSPAPCATVPAIKGNVTLQPGTYCQDIVATGSSKVTFAPGAFYLKGAKLAVTQSASLISQGSTIFLDATSSLAVSTSGAVNLSAPTSGVYKGLTIFQSRSAASSTTNSLVGGGNYVIKGTIYAPSTQLKMASVGSTAQDAYVSSIVVGVLTLSGDSDWHSVTDPLTTPSGLSPIPTLVY